jgi:hypothetical protein
MRSLGLIICLGLAAPAAAADFYSLTVSRDGNAYSMSADAHLAAPPAAVYAVLTDYEHLTRISSAVVKSRVVQRLDGGDALVYTDSRACALFFCKHITEVQRYSKPDTEDIVAVVVPAQSNLQSGRTVWHMEAEGAGTRLHWEMTAVPAFWVPPFIGPSLVQRGLRGEGQRGVAGVEKLARERAHLPPLESEPKDAEHPSSN